MRGVYLSIDDTVVDKSYPEKLDEVAWVYSFTKGKDSDIQVMILTRFMTHLMSIITCNNNML
ncbi:MAG: hypothetical protein HQK79_10090 [Desulfobacterales bacterium]|nr:hypothetical protein [Desulfobacterales bacterium]